MLPVLTASRGPHHGGGAGEVEKGKNTQPYSGEPGPFHFPDTDTLCQKI